MLFEMRICATKPWGQRTDRLFRLLCLALCLGTPALAEPDRVSILVGSYHINPGSEFDESNPGLFLTWEEAGGGPLNVSVGAFENSYGRGAAAVLASYPFFENDTIELSVFGGVAHYPEDGRNFAVSIGDVVPLAGVQMQIGPTFFQFLPGDGNEADAVVSFGLTAPLDF